MNLFEASRILGCDPQEAKTMLAGQRPNLEEVEAMALERYSCRHHADDPDSYWVTVSSAAEILGVSIQRVKQLLDKGFLPYVTHRDGARLMRREQVETVAIARASRRWQAST